MGREGKEREIMTVLKQMRDLYKFYVIFGHMYR